MEVELLAIFATLFIKVDEHIFLLYITHRCIYACSDHIAVLPALDTGRWTMNRYDRYQMPRYRHNNDPRNFFINYIVMELLCSLYAFVAGQNANLSISCFFGESRWPRWSPFFLGCVWHEFLSLLKWWCEDDPFPDGNFSGANMSSDNCVTVHCNASKIARSTIPMCSDLCKLSGSYWYKNMYSFLEGQRRFLRILNVIDEPCRAQ